MKLPNLEASLFNVPKLKSNKIEKILIYYFYNIVSRSN